MRQIKNETKRSGRVMRVRQARMAALLAGSAAAIHGGQAYAAPISLTTIATPYTQDFDSILGVVPADNSTLVPTLPTGWAFSEADTGANTSVRVHNGGGNSGDTYLFGASGSAERAFGGLFSGSLDPTIGVEFVNNTGSTITSLDIDYIGEMWRAGFASRGAADRLDFEFSTDATSLTTGIWTGVDALDFNSPVTSTTAGAKDGNNATFQTNVVGSIGSLSIANGSTFWLRWTDFDIASSDDGLAVDTFSLTPQSSGGGGPQTLTWNGGVGGQWQDGGAGWLDGVTPETWDSSEPDNAIFDGNPGIAVSVDTGIVANTVTFDADSYTLSNNSLEVQASITANGSAVINSDVDLTNATPALTIGVGKTLTFGGDVSTPSATSPINVGGTGTLLFSGTVTGLTDTDPDPDNIGIDANNATIQVNDTINSGVQIDSGETGTVTGNGTINGTVDGFSDSTVAGGLTIQDLRTSGNLKPGGDDAAGQISVNNAFQYFNGTTYHWDLLSLTDNPANAGTQFDFVTTSTFAPNFTTATGVVNLDFAAGVSPDDGDSFWTSDRLWKIMAVTGESGANTDDFDTLTFNSLSLANQGKFSLGLGGDFGQAGEDADDVFLSFDADAGPPAVTLAVTEFMANPDSLGDADGEWLELYNYGTDPVDLTGWGLEDEDSDAHNLPSVTINPGGFIIIAKDKAEFEAEWLGGVPNASVFQISGLTLGNGDDELLVLDASDNIVWRLAWDGGILDGQSVYLLDGSFGFTNYGTQDGVQIALNGLDPATGTTGYETNTLVVGDNASFLSLGGDRGSPLALGNATIQVIPEPVSGLFMLMGSAVMVRPTRSRRKPL